MEAGLEPGRNRMEYDAHVGYRHLLEGLQRRKAQTVMQHVHPTEELSPECYWISRELLCFLNNKGNLGRLVPAENLPRREVLSRTSVLPERTPVPVVLKAATDLSSGGGKDVRICRTRRQVRDALRYFASCDRIVVEELLRFEKSHCVQFGALPDGRILDLGMAEQITDPAGRFLGNWLTAPEETPAELVAIGRAIVERGVALGYRGIAGFDAAVCADGRPVVFDLNFRLNGSTAPLLLHAAMARRMGTALMRYRSWTAADGFEGLERAVRRAVGKGFFLPLCIYDPEGTASPGRRPLLSGVVAGGSREEILERERELARTGLV
jgi:hypothetical protein